MTKKEYIGLSLDKELFIQNGKEADEIIGIIGDSVLTLFRGHLENTWHIDDVKPILRPLSDLTKPIKHKGEEFVPIVELLKNNCFDTAKMSKEEIISYADVFSNVDLITLNDLSLYLKWHFNLMDEGEEFIDVNTLEFNPYE